MSIIGDLRHIYASIGRALRTRPSVAERSGRMQRALQIGMQRGMDYGMQRARMYYPGAESGVLQNDWSSSLYSITSLINSELKKLAARSESAVRTDAIAKRAMQIMSTFVVGQGNKPFPAVRKYNGDPVEGVNQKLALDWERFNDEAVRTSTQSLTMYELQALEFETIFTYGSDLIKTVSARRGSWLPYSFQLLKPTRLDFSKDNYIDSTYATQPNPLIVHGIEFSGAFADPAAFYLEGLDKISADQMSLAFRQTEAEQYLGLPWLTPVLPQVWDNQQLFFDKLKQSRIGAKLGFKIGKKDGAGINAILDTDTSSGDTYMDLDFQGLYVSDDKPEPISITDPISDTFEALVKLTLLYISIGVGVSYGTLTSDLNNSNFSAARANTIIENRMFRRLYKWFTKAVCQQRWNKFVEWEFLTGRLPGYTDYLKDPWYYSQCFWLPMDGEDWIDPLKDQEALVLAYKMGQVTYQELCATRGKSPSAMISQLQREREELTAAGLEYLLPENVNGSSAPAPAQAPAQQDKQNAGGMTNE